VLTLLRRPRVLVLLAVVAAGLAVLVVAAARSGTPGCTTPAPDVDLPAQLRTLGGFDQPIDPSDVRSLQEAAVSAATALHSDLRGATAGTPVAIAADHPAQNDALVIPLTEAGTDPTAPLRVAALAAFLRDCSGRAWYDDVDDLLHTDPSLLPQEFPLVSQAAAAENLGVAQPRLVWRTSPFRPLWLDPSSGRTLSAGPPI
jgi:hypothetical protein